MKIIMICSLLLVCLIGNTQTTLYPCRLVTAPISPTINAGWTITSTTNFYMLYPSKSTPSLVASAANSTSGNSTTTSPQKMICASLISPAMNAQTVNSGATFSAQFRVLKNASASTGHAFFYVRLCNEDGTNIREVGNGENTTSALTTTLTNKTLTLTLGSNLTINDGDRLLIEVGEAFTAGSTNHACSFGFNSNSSNTGNLPVDNTTLTALLPWVQCSQTLSMRKIGISL